MKLLLLSVLFSPIFNSYDVGTDHFVLLQTIAIISVSPQIVVQFGSTQKVSTWKMSKIIANVKPKYMHPLL